MGSYSRQTNLNYRPQMLSDTILSPFIGGDEGFVNVFQEFLSVHQGVGSITEVA